MTIKELPSTDDVYLFRDDLRLITEPQDKWCLFLYSASKDINVIEGQCPVFFNSREELDEYISSNPRQIDEWTKKEYQLVIRKIKIIY